MPVILYNGETQLSELADKLFTRLTAKQRDKVGDALLKANPQLGDLTTVSPGTVLEVPDLPELSAKAQNPETGPDTQIISQLQASLADYGKYLDAQIRLAQAQMADTEQVLSSDVLIKITRADPVLKELVAGIAKSNGERRKQLEEQQQTTGQALERLIKELAG